MQNLTFLGLDQLHKRIWQETIPECEQEALQPAIFTVCIQRCVVNIWQSILMFFWNPFKINLIFLSEVLTIYFPLLEATAAAAKSLFETKIGFADLDLLLRPACYLNPPVVCSTFSSNLSPQQIFSEEEMAFICRGYHKTFSPQLEEFIKPRDIHPTQSTMVSVLHPSEIAFWNWKVYQITAMVNQIHPHGSWLIGKSSLISNKKNKFFYFSFLFFCQQGGICLNKVIPVSSIGFPGIKQGGRLQLNFCHKPIAFLFLFFVVVLYCWIAFSFWNFYILKLLYCTFIGQLHFDFETSNLSHKPNAFSFYSVFLSKINFILKLLYCIFILSVSYFSYICLLNFMLSAFYRTQVSLGSDLWVRFSLTNWHTLLQT